MDVLFSSICIVWNHCRQLMTLKIKKNWIFVMMNVIITFCSFFRWNTDALQWLVTFAPQYLICFLLSYVNQRLKKERLAQTEYIEWSSWWPLIRFGCWSTTFHKLLQFSCAEYLKNKNIWSRSPWPEFLLWCQRKKWISEF